MRTARARFAKCQIIQADCDGWPFPGVTVKFAIADFDAYAYPYDSFRAWWSNAHKADRVILFFTDGQRQPLMRTDGHIHLFDGRKVKIESLAERRQMFNMYFIRFALPWFKNAIKSWRVIKSTSYLRGQMLYWGAVIEKA